MLLLFKGRFENNSLFQKIKSGVCYAIPPGKRGVTANRHLTRARDAMAAMRAQTKRVTRTAKSCGPDPPTLGSSFWRDVSREATVAKKPGHRGERV